MKTKTKTKAPLARSLLVVGEHPDGQVVAGPVDFWTAGFVAMQLRNLSCGNVRTAEAHRPRLLRLEELAGAVRPIVLAITLHRCGPKGGQCSEETLTVGAVQLLDRAELDPRPAGGPGFTVISGPPPVEQAKPSVSQEMRAASQPAASLPPWAITVSTRLAQGLAVALFAIIHWRLLPKLAVRLLCRTTGSPAAKQRRAD